MIWAIRAIAVRDLPFLQEEGLLAVFSLAPGPPCVQPIVDGGKSDCVSVTDANSTRPSTVYLSHSLVLQYFRQPIS